MLGWELIGFSTGGIGRSLQTRKVVGIRSASRYVVELKLVPVLAVRSGACRRGERIGVRPENGVVDVPRNLIARNACIDPSVAFVVIGPVSSHLGTLPTPHLRIVAIS